MTEWTKRQRLIRIRRATRKRCDEGRPTNDAKDEDKDAGEGAGKGGEKDDVVQDVEDG